LSTQTKNTTYPIGDIETVREAAHRGEGPICLELFLELFFWYFFVIFFSVFWKEKNHLYFGI
jgi:hypothetical protein